MDEASFWALHSMHKKDLVSKKRKRGRPNPSTDIPSELKLSIAIRFFAGGDLYDLMISHGVSMTSIYASVWQVVDAINSNNDLAIEFPKDHAVQRRIADGFRKKSQVDFGGCVGAIDGMLVWTTKPSTYDCEQMSVGAKRF